MFEFLSCDDSQSHIEVNNSSWEERENTNYSLTLENIGRKGSEEVSQKDSESIISARPRF